MRTILVVEPPSSFDLVAASLRADQSDLRTFVEVLAAKLEQSLPGRCRVQRGGLFGRGRVRQITVEMGDGRYELLHRDGAVWPRRASVVRGITVKSSESSLQEWLDALAAELVTEADRSERGRVALERLLDI